MIVLDATTKFLEVQTPSGKTMDSVVSYWSIDASNMWTPHSFEATGDSGTTILPAPAEGETKVVENIWIDAPAQCTLYVRMDIGGGASRPIGTIVTPAGSTIFTLSRDGVFTRQESVFAGVPANKTQNTH